MSAIHISRGLAIAEPFRGIAERHRQQSALSAELLAVEEDPMGFPPVWNRLTRST
ncbi:uncharacterized protein RAG0_16938 [Rhynchosporium agropyri]|uniref:Uncharacterized protein n=1 Tax=Rhynchosporium agropyri TaxID=914238 RepID=A0A1E1LSF4_9HELO|nr:uncharacterized protein RAG0_16938 [Rhynchosporium agropyri]